jgi:hypothetical protein
MPRILPYLLAAGSILFVSCSKQEPSAAPPPKEVSLAPVDACALLTSEEIASVQGEPIQQTTPTTQSAAGFAVSQCYFALPTHANSIVVTVTQPAAGDARALRAQWNETFHSSGEREAEGGEEKEKAPPRAVAGIGEEAYWTGSSITGALYILQGGRQIRISLGGAGDTNVKIDKAEALAEFILKRL